MNVLLNWNRLPWGKNKKEGWYVIPENEDDERIFAVFGATITEEQARAACVAMGFTVVDTIGK
jgi:hypothetical protein